MCHHKRKLFRAFLMSLWQIESKDPQSTHDLLHHFVFSRRHPILRGAAVNHSPPLILLNTSLTGSKTFLFFLFIHSECGGKQLVHVLTAARLKQMLKVVLCEKP